MALIYSKVTTYVYLDKSLTNLAEWVGNIQEYTNTKISRNHLPMVNIHVYGYILIIPNTMNLQLIMLCQYEEHTVCTHTYM